MATTVLMERNGPAGKGLEDWGGYPSEEIVAGTPAQRGYSYLDDSANKVIAGVWECTPMTGKMGAWSSNEFMVILEGSVTVVHEDGEELRVDAGECFMIPKGTMCQWKQSERVKKLYVIDESPANARPANSNKLRAVKIDTKAALDPAKGPDPALVVGGEPPTWHDRLVYEDPTGQFMVGVWSTTPYERKTIEFPRHELMLLLEGSVTIKDGRGDNKTFRAGDTLFIEKGASVGWLSTEPVRKVYCIYLPKAAAAQQQSAAE